MWIIYFLVESQSSRDMVNGLQARKINLLLLTLEEIIFDHFY